MATASSSMGRQENIFHEIGTGVASSTTTLNKGPYDVFINHRGPDVKLKLASSIYHFLDRLGVRVFLDREELELGDFFPKAIEDVIRSAVIHIALFSINYARSPYCLEELSLMQETGSTIIPIFYHVEPADLRRGVTRGSYADAFSDYKANGRYKLEMLQKWKEALDRVSFFTGYEYTSNSDEGILLKRIVNRVLQDIKNLKVPFDVAPYSVGVDDAVREFESERCLGGNRNVEIVGIVGMGGCGKTTLAKEIYNRKYCAYDNCSFLFRVRENPLHELQKQLLEDVVHMSIPFEDASEGKSILAGRLRSLRVLIVLDDVNDVNQLNALLPEMGRHLGSGSLIVITTRDSNVLRSYPKYKMRELNPCQAKELFCWHAFVRSSPPAAYEDLVQQFIEACDRLPLSLEVTAGMLYGKSEKQWRSVLEKVSGLLPIKIKDSLRLSYDALDDEEKNIFLDVACFFVGEKKSLAIAVWDEAGWSDLENLVSKCLVEIDNQNRIRMNTNLRDLGREVAIECSPHRLWSTMQMTRIMSHTEKTLQIRGIMAATTQFSSCSAHHEFPSYSSSYQPPLKEYLKLIQSSISRSFPSRPLSLGLKLLVLTGDDFNRELAKLSEDLVWLRWFDFKLTTLPSWESLRNLRILELYGATTLKELWQDAKPPPFKQLIELNITCNWGSSLQSFPRSISDLKHLRKIALIGYLGDEFPIKRLPEEFCSLNKLEHLELRHCRLLSSLPSRFGQLTMLRHLDLCSCVELRMLPVSFNQLTCLEYLDLSGCRKLTFRLDFLKNISKLQKLDFTGCRRLHELPSEIASRAYLRQLSMRDTRLKNMPSNMDQLRKFSTLQIGSPFLRSLPPSVGVLSSLSHLTIFDCPNLESFPDSIGCLCRLQYLCIELSGVKSLPNSFRQLASLEAFEISCCPIEELNFGKEFSSSSCLSSLKLLRIVDTQLSRVSISDDCCPVLKTLQLMLNEVLVEIVTLPTSLEEIKLWECERLEDITCIQNLPNLKHIDK